MASRRQDMHEEIPDVSFREVFIHLMVPRFIRVSRKQGNCAQTMHFSFDSTKMWTTRYRDEEWDASSRFE